MGKIILTIFVILFFVFAIYSVDKSKFKEKMFERMFTASLFILVAFEIIYMIWNM